MGRESADSIIKTLVEKYHAEKNQRKAADTIKKIIQNILKSPTGKRCHTKKS